jgi:hypothetical protein
MMKRIISLLLVIVMSVGVLSSCAFNYAKEDMASYAEFDVNTFKAGLVDGIKLVIDDGDFGLDENERKNKVQNTILSALAALATKKYTSGVLDGVCVISRGLGNHTRVPRIFNPPELVLISLSPSP